MNKRVEIEMNESAAHQDERRGGHVDLADIVRRNKLSWFSFKVKRDDGERVQFFVHERFGTKTGLKFNRKADMVDALVAFDTAHATNPDMSLVIWGGRRGCDVMTEGTGQSTKRKHPRAPAVPVAEVAS